jgi:hypothetical protein
MKHVESYPTEIFFFAATNAAFPAVGTPNSAATGRTVVDTTDTEAETIIKEAINRRERRREVT